MRFYGYALAASALALFACGGGGEKAGDSTPADTATTVTPPPTPSGAGPTISGTTHEVRMEGDATGYRFVPAAITVKTGDGIRFINVSGGPHNVAADPAKIPDDVEPILSANMPNQMSPLNGPLLMNPNEAYIVSFAGIKPGTYELNCTPHLAMGMIIKVTVE